MRRAHPDETACAATWPITGRACKNLPGPGSETCDAHDPGGDKRPAPLEDERRCTATNKESGERCRRRHEVGGKVCPSHGGASKRARSGAKTRVGEQRAREMVATYGLPVDISPEQAILDEVHRTAGHVAWLEQVIQGLEPEDLVWGVTRIKEGGEDRGTTEEAVPHAFLKLYQTERAHLVKVCAEAIRVGIEARQVKLAEQQGALVAQTIRSILGDLRLTAEQRALIPSVVPQHLRELALRN